METKFRPNRGFLYLAAILYLDYHGNGRHLEFFQPPKAAKYYGGYSYKVDHNMALKPWISIPNIKIYLETKSGGFLYFGDHFGFKMAAIANQRWISIRNIIIYLETKFRPNRRILYFGGHFESP